MTVQRPYEETGRTRQKARTRSALLAAARELLEEGREPTVEQAAQHAGVSRTTAYRYFANHRELLAATYPGLEAPSLIDDPALEAPHERFEAALASIGRQLLEHEAVMRAQLRLALDPAMETSPPLRQGRMIGWLEDALAPLRDSLPRGELRRLVLAVRATLGIEAMIWLTDVAGLSSAKAVELMQQSARTLLRDALRQHAPEDLQLLK